jgi:hypothetical protein
MYEQIIKEKLKRYYKNHSREKCFLNLKDIQTVLILFNTSDFEESDAFVRKVKKLGKKVTVYAYKGKNDEQDYSKTLYRIITAKETGNLFDNKMNEIVNELDKKKFDAVIDLTIRRIIPLEYLLAHSNAYIKAGLKKNDFPQYDLSITSLPNAETEKLKVRELGKQIVYYLHTIHAKQD